MTRICWKDFEEEQILKHTEELILKPGQVFVGSQTSIIQFIDMAQKEILPENRQRNLQNYRSLSVLGKVFERFLDLEGIEVKRVQTYYYKDSPITEQPQPQVSQEVVVAEKQEESSPDTMEGFKKLLKAFIKGPVKEVLKEILKEIREEELSPPQEEVKIESTHKHHPEPIQVKTGNGVKVKRFFIVGTEPDQRHFLQNSFKDRAILTFWEKDDGMGQLRDKLRHGKYDKVIFLSSKNGHHVQTAIVNHINDHKKLVRPGDGSGSAIKELIYQLM